MALETIATDEAVFKAADDLIAAGKKASVRAISAELGGGGMNTISAALRRWKHNQELKTTETIARADLPSNLIDVMHSATAEIWNAALAETKAEIEQLTLSFNARLAEAHQEREDALLELEEATQELECLKSENEILTMKCNAFEAVQEINKQEKDSLKNRAETAEHKAETENAARLELIARVEQITELLKQEKTNNTTTRATLEKTQQEKAKIEGMLTVYESIRGKQEEQPKATSKRRKTAEATGVKNEH